MSFTTTSSLLPFLLHQISAQFIVQALQHFYTQDRVMQRQEERAGKVPASPLSALSNHTVAPSVTVTSNYAAAKRNIFKSGLHSCVLLDELKISTASSSEEAI